MYKNPPITEALWDVRVTLPEGFNYEEFELYYQEKLKDAYPIKEVSVQYETSIEVKGLENPGTTVKGGPNGFFFKSSDGKRIIQFRTNGFTFNVLKPYSNWEEFTGEAQAHFSEYLKISNAIKIERLGLRYINRLDVPLPIKDLKEYILTLPQIAPGLPQTLDNFLMRVILPQEENLLNTGIVTVTVGKPKSQNTELPIIFDIDVYRNLGVTADKVDYVKIFEEFRAYKNDIFEKSLTRKMKSLFEL